MFGIRPSSVLVLRVLRVKFHSNNSDFLVEANSSDIQLFRGVSSVRMDLSSIHKTWMHHLFNEELLIIDVVIQLITVISFNILQVPYPNGAISRGTDQILIIEVPAEIMDQVSMATQNDLEVAVFAIIDFDDCFVV